MTRAIGLHICFFEMEIPKIVLRIGRQNPQYYEVLEGLEKGERVIVSGYESYKEEDIGADEVWDG